MKIKNVSSSNIDFSDIKNVDGTGLLLSAGQEITIFDEDAEKSPSLRQYIIDGYIQKTGDAEPGDPEPVDIELVDKVVRWITSGDVAIQFTNPINGSIQNTYSGTHGIPVVIGIAVTNGAGVIDSFNQVAIIVITIDTGTIDGVAGPVTKIFVNGVITCSINRANAGDVNITLSGGNTSLDRTDTAKVTFA